MRDKRVAGVYRSLGLILCLGSLLHLWLSSSEHRWFYAFLGWTTFAVALGISKYRIHRKSTRYLKRIVEEFHGIFKGGKFLFAVPPRIKFRYQGRFCEVGHTIDPKWDYRIEFVYPVEREIELRITRRKKEFSVEGKDKEWIQPLLSDSQKRILLERLMQEFRYLYIGRDGGMRLGAEYDSELTVPERVIATFDHMITLGHFLEAQAQAGEGVGLHR